MPETEETETTTKPSRTREITAVVATLAVTVVIGIASGALTKKVNAEVTRRIKNEKTEDTDN